MRESEPMGNGGRVNPESRTLSGPLGRLHWRNDMNAIQTIEAEIAKLEAQISGLRYACTLLHREAPAVPWPEPASVEPPAKKPSPPVAPSRPEAGTARRSTIERRQAIAKFLVESGPQSMSSIEVQVGAVPATIRADLTESGLFQRINPTNRLSPWTLTESGRKFAESSGPG